MSIPPIVLCSSFIVTYLTAVGHKLILCCFHRRGKRVRDVAFKVSIFVNNVDRKVIQKKKKST